MKKETQWMKLVSASGLGLFRIAYGIILLLEVWQLFRFRHLIFDPIPFIEMSQFSFGWLLAGWMVVVLFLIIGWNTFLISIINYFLTVVIIGGFTSFEYHLDYIITGTNFLFIFIPVGVCFSVDEFLQKNKYTPQRVAVGNYYILLLFGLALVYIDSIFWKLSSPMWRGGLGVWLPASLPQISYRDISSLLDQKWLIKGLGYLTLAFEFLFIFLFTLSKARIPLLLIGIGLHLGISLVFPIPLFGWGVACFYILMIPLKFSDRLWLLIQPFIAKLQIYESVEIFSYMTFSPKKVIRIHPKVIQWFVIVAILIQTCLIVNNSPMFGFREYRIQVFDSIYDVSRRFLGITSHPVFMDEHFREYNYLIAISYRDKSGLEQWLPIINISNNPGNYLRGRIWCYWSWNINGPNVNAERLVKGIQRFTAFWAYQHRIALHQAKFDIRIKQINIPQRWEKGSLKKQKANQWTDGGYVTWENQQMLNHLTLPF